MKKLFVCCAVVWICGLASLSAQSNALIRGYYLTPQGDSVTGFFEPYGLENNFVKFSTTGRVEDLTRLGPGQVAKIVGEGSFLVFTQELSWQGETEKIFAVQIMSGDISLFKGVSKHQGKLFFIRTRDQPEVVKINSRAPKTFLQVYFEGCNFKGAIAYQEASLIRALISYQECRYGNSNVSTRENGLRKASRFPKPAFTVGIKAHYAVAGSGSPTGWYSGDYTLNSGSGYGAFVRINLLRNLSVQTGASFLQKSIASDTMEKGLRYLNQDYFTYRAPITLDYRQIEIPVQARWAFWPDKRLSPFISVGYAAHFLKKVTATRDFTTAYKAVNPLQPVSLEDAQDIRAHGFYWNSNGHTGFVEIGGTARLVQRLRLELAGRFIADNNKIYAINNSGFIKSPTVLHINYYEISAGVSWQINAPKR